MKTCMCCKTDAAPEAAHCLHCGEGSWSEVVQPVTKPTGPKGAPGRLASMAAAALVTDHAATLDPHPLDELVKPEPSK
jgi:hypothetical protein